jgi:hypothetical protein
MLDLDKGFLIWGSDPQDLVSCSLGSSVLNWLWWCLSVLWLLVGGNLLVVLLLLGDILLLALVLVTLLAFLTILTLLLDVSVVLLSWLEVLLVVVVLVSTLILVSLSSMRSVVVLHLVVVPVLTVHLWLRNEELGLGTEVQALKLSLHGNWSWAQVLVGVKSAEGSHFSKAGDLDERWWLWVQWAELEWTDGGA